jgi:uncharacterized protein
VNNDPRSVVLAFLDDVTHSGLGVAARHHATEDVTWWLPATLRPEPFQGRKEVISWFETRGGDTLFHAPPQVVVERVLVDGNVAAAQVRSTGSAISGRHYDNRYMFVMTVDHGQITELREFFDTKHVFDTFHSEPSQA